MMGSWDETLHRQRQAIRIVMGISFVVGLIAGYFIFAVWPLWPLIKTLFYSCNF